MGFHLAGSMSLVGRFPHQAHRDPPDSACSRVGSAHQRQPASVDVVTVAGTVVTVPSSSYSEPALARRPSLCRIPFSPQYYLAEILPGVKVGMGLHRPLAIHRKSPVYDGS